MDPEYTQSFEGEIEVRKAIEGIDMKHPVVIAIEDEYVAAMVGAPELHEHIRDIDKTFPFPNIVSVAIPSMPGGRALQRAYSEQSIKLPNLGLLTGVLSEANFVNRLMVHANVYDGEPTTAAIMQRLNQSRAMRTQRIKDYDVTIPLEERRGQTLAGTLSEILAITPELRADGDRINAQLTSPGHLVTVLGDMQRIRVVTDVDLSRFKNDDINSAHDALEKILSNALQPTMCLDALYVTSQASARNFDNVRDDAASYGLAPYIHMIVAKSKYGLTKSGYWGHRMAQDLADQEHERLVHDPGSYINIALANV